MRRRQQPWPLWTPNRVMGRHYGMGRPLRKPCVAAAITVWVDHYWHPALQLPLRYGLTIMDTQSCDGPPLRYGLTITDTLCSSPTTKKSKRTIMWWEAITAWVTIKDTLRSPRTTRRQWQKSCASSIFSSKKPHCQRQDYLLFLCSLLLLGDIIYIIMFCVIINPAFEPL